jgi:hypothetical protein
MTPAGGVARSDGKLRRALARAMPSDVPRGPWQCVRNVGVRERRRRGEPEPQPCAMCDHPIKRNTFSYYQMQAATTPEWADAVLHYMCGQALQYYLGENRIYLRERDKDE